MKQLLALIFLTLLTCTSVWALDIKQAKSQGLVGERNDGYLGYVVKPPSDAAKTLVKEVNNKRKAKFNATAKKNNLKSEQVANRFYQRAVGKTAGGHYYQNAAGDWIKK